MVLKERRSASAFHFVFAKWFPCTYWSLSLLQVCKASWWCKNRNKLTSWQATKRRATSVAKKLAGEHCSKLSDRCWFSNERNYLQINIFDIWSNWSVVVGWPGGSPACLPQRPGHGSQVSNLNNTYQVFNILRYWSLPVPIPINPYQFFSIRINLYRVFYIQVSIIASPFNPYQFLSILNPQSLSNLLEYSISLSVLPNPYQSSPILLIWYLIFRAKLLQ